MRLRQVLPVIVGVSLFVGSGHPVVLRAQQIGDQFVFVIKHERIDPGDRRPR
jgi:hypothetical protein